MRHYREALIWIQVDQCFQVFDPFFFSVSTTSTYFTISSILTVKIINTIPSTSYMYLETLLCTSVFELHCTAVGFLARSLLCWTYSKISVPCVQVVCLIGVSWYTFSRWTVDWTYTNAFLADMSPNLLRCSTNKIREAKHRSVQRWCVRRTKTNARNFFWAHSFSCRALSITC